MSAKPKKTKKIVEDLKVVVRKLPPTLTEEIFMKSVQAFNDIISYKYFVQGKNK